MVGSIASCIPFDPTLFFSVVNACNRRNDIRVVNLKKRTMINNLAEEIYKNNLSKGFHEGEKNTGEMLALIHSEVSEALEADRKDRYASKIIPGAAKLFGFSDTIEVMKALADENYGYTFNSRKSFYDVFIYAVKDTFEDELADVVIRVFDLAASKNIDIESHILAKMRFNEMREFKHGKKY